MVQGECLGKQLAQAPCRLLPVPRIAAHEQVRGKLAHCLPTGPARWRGLIRFTGNRNLLERRKSLRHRCCDGYPLRAQRFTVRGILDIASCDYLTACCLNRRANAKARVRRVRILHRGECGILQALAVCLFVRHLDVRLERNDSPAPRYETPSHSPTVAPRSENVWRTPRSTGDTAGPMARRGTRSRA